MASSAERRRLAGLLANEKAVIPLLRFLKATEVEARGRVGTKKRLSRRRSAKIDSRGEHPKAAV